LRKSDGGLQIHNYFQNYPLHSRLRFPVKGLSIKDVRSQWGFVQCGHFVDRGRGGLQMRTSALFREKNFGIFEIYDVPARTREGWANADI